MRCETLLLAALTLALLSQPIQAIDLSALDGGVEASANTGNAVERGKYVLRAAGCVTCHTAEDSDAVPLAGGRALLTEFGTFFSPNITPDTRTGIGNFSLEDFRRALREGVAPDGSYYYPAFPYTSYAGMADGDVEDLFAYLQSLTPVVKDRPPHELNFPYSIRSLLGPWRSLYFEPDGIVPQLENNEQWNRGAYLVNALAHCGECHTPRNRLGALDSDKYLQGADGEHAGPDITQTGEVSAWSREDWVFFLQSGFYPSNDVAGSGMGAVIFDGLAALNQTDIEAMVSYLQTVE